MTEEQSKLDLVELVVQALAQRVKEAIRLEVQQWVADAIGNTDVEADDINGLEKFVDHSIEEYYRHESRKVDADDVDGLEDFIKETMKQASISIDF